MPLTDAERERVRYHLGYIDVSSAASLSYGVPAGRQMLFVVELALSNVLESAIPRVRQILGVMDGIEQKLIEAQDRLAAIQLGSLKLRETEPDQLEKEYTRWGLRLADLFGIPPYYYSTRYRNVGTVSAGSIPVRS